MITTSFLLETKKWKQLLSMEHTMFQSNKLMKLSKLKIQFRLKQKDLLMLSKSTERLISQSPSFQKNIGRFSETKWLLKLIKRIIKSQLLQ